MKKKHHLGIAPETIKENGSDKKEPQVLYDITITLKEHARQIVVDHVSEFKVEHKDGRIVGLSWTNSSITQNRLMMVNVDSVACVTQRISQS